MIIDVIDVTADGKRRLLANKNGRLFETHGKLTGDFTGRIVAHTPVPLIPDVVLGSPKAFVKKTLIDLDESQYGVNPFVPLPGEPVVAKPAITDLSTLPPGPDGKYWVIARANGSNYELVVNGQLVQNKPLVEVSEVIIYGTIQDDLLTVVGNLNKTITFAGRGGHNSLTLNDRTNTWVSYYTFTNGKLQRAQTPPLTIDYIYLTVCYTGIENITINANDGGSMILVKDVASGTRVTINGGNTYNNFVLGTDRFPAYTGDMSDIRGELVLNGGTGNNGITMLDQDDTDPFKTTSFCVTATGVRRISESSLAVWDSEQQIWRSYIDILNIALNNVQAVNIWGSATRAERYEILSTGNFQLNITGGKGDNLFLVGSQDYGLSSVISTGPYHLPVLDGGPGLHNRLVLNDRNGGIFSTTSFTYTITSGSLRRAITAGYGDLDGTWRDLSQTSDTLFSRFADVDLYGAKTNITYNMESFGGGANASRLGLHTGEAKNIVIVGAGSYSVDNLRGALSVESFGGSDTLVVNDQANPYLDTGSNPGMIMSYPGRRGYMIDTGTTASGIKQTRIMAGSYAVIYDNGGFASINLNTGVGANYVWIPGTPAEAAVGVYASGGDNIINVGGYLLDNIRGPLSVIGGNGNSKLWIDDTLAASAHTYTVTATTLNRSGAAPITYGSVQGLQIQGTRYNDLFTVTSTAAGTPVTLKGGAGNVTFVVGNDTNGVDDLLSPVLVGGQVAGQGTASLTVNDRAHVKGAGGRLYMITANGFTAGPASIQNIGGVTNLTLNTGNGTDEIYVSGTRAKTVTTVNAGSGDKTFRVGSFSSMDTWEYVEGALTLNGGTGNNQLVMEATEYTADRTYSITATTVTRDGAAPITYNKMNSLSITADTGGNTSFSVASTAPGMTVTLQGFSFLGKSSTLRGSDAANTWQITGAKANRGSLSGDTLASPVAFQGICNLVGGAGPDKFIFTAGGSLTGSIDGGAGINSLDYTAYTTDVVVNLRLGTATGLIGKDSYLANIQNVTGGSGPGYNILVGNGGNVLTGGNGRNLLIAGGTRSTLIGGTDQDILIGGTTAFDVNPAALLAIMAEWTRTDLGYLDRVDHILKGGGLNGGNVLNATTVTGNKAGNTLTRGPGLDLFFGDLTLDKTNYDKAKEMFIPV
jgi:hypothetical protein